MFYKFAYAIVINLFRVLYRVHIDGRQNIPEGAAVVCANHTASSDPIFMVMGMTRKQKLHFMAKIELIKNPVFAFVLRRLGVFFVDRGNTDVKAIKHALTLLRRNEKVSLFPEGHRVGPDESIAAKNGAAMLALRSGACFLPVSITPGHKKLFSHVRVVIGKPFHAVSQSGTRRVTAETLKSITDELMRRITTLHEQHV